MKRRTHLPSGAVATFDEDAAPGAAPGIYDEEARSMRLTIRACDGTPVGLGALPLGDFHTLRAIARRLRVIADPPIPIECINCRHHFEVTPGATLELGPYVDGELDDPVLDETLAFGEAHDIAGGSTVVFRATTLVEAEPLHRALARASGLRFSSAIVEALGVERLGEDHDPRMIGRRLASLDDAAFDRFADAHERTHYPPRLSTPHRCPKCRAVEYLACPANRELSTHGPRTETQRDTEPFLGADAFEALVREVAASVYAELSIVDVGLTVRTDAAAVDEGGSPLLGCYDPPNPTAIVPHGGEVTLFYRTFEAIWEEEGRYDVGGEVEETIRHELEHHFGFLAGGDALGTVEADALADEYVGRVGRHEARRRAAADFARDVVGFLRSTWWLWLIALIVTVLVLMDHG